MQKINDFTSSFNSNDLEKASNELYNEIINDKELHNEILSLGISNNEIYEHIGFFSRYKEAKDKEKMIKTYDDCVRFNCFYASKIVRNGENFEIAYDALPCYKEFLKYKSSFVFKDFGPEFNNINMSDNIDKKINSEILKCLKNKEHKNWIYLTGSYRSGRTYTAIALLNSIVRKNNAIKVAFVNTNKRFNQLIDLFFKDKNEFSTVMKSLCEVDYLVLDDFGSESKNSYIRDNVIIPLLSERGNLDKCTIFTTSCSILELKKIYTYKATDQSSLMMADQVYEILKSKISKEINLSNLPNLY